MCGAVEDEKGGSFAALLVRDTSRLGASDPGLLCPERISVLVTRMNALVRGCYRISLKLPLQGGSMEQNVSLVIMGENQDYNSTVTQHA